MDARHGCELRRQFCANWWRGAGSGLPWWLSGEESTCSAEVAGDLGLIPGLGRSPGGGNGSPPQYSCLENPMDGGAWRAVVHGVTESDTTVTTAPTQGRSTPFGCIPAASTWFQKWTVSQASVRQPESFLQAAGSVAFSHPRTRCKWRTVNPSITLCCWTQSSFTGRIQTSEM